jgi:hypothetical protein
MCLFIPSTCEVRVFFFFRLCLCVHLWNSLHWSTCLMCRCRVRRNHSNGLKLALCSWQRFVLPLSSSSDCSPGDIRVGLEEEDKYCLLLEGEAKSRSRRPMYYMLSCCVRRRCDHRDDGISSVHLCLIVLRFLSCTVQQPKERKETSGYGFNSRNVFGMIEPARLVVG